MSAQLKKWLEQNPAVGSEEFNPEEELNVEVPEVQEVPEEALYEAEDDMEEVAAERAAAVASMEEYDALVEDSIEMVAAMEDYAEVLAIGIESGEYSPQFAGVATSALKRYNEMFGTEESTPSLEDYTHENLDQLYVASLEGFKETIGKVRSAVVNAAKSSKDYMGAIGTNDKAAKALNTKADAALGRLSSAEVSDKEISIKGLGKVFSQAGKLPGDVTALVNADLRSMNYLATKHLQNNVAYYKDIVETLGKSVKEHGTHPEVLKAFAGKQTPADAVSSGMKTGEQLLGSKVVVGAKPSGATAMAMVDGLIDKLDEENGLFEKVTESSGSVKLNKAQVTSLLKAAKSYAGLLETLNREAKKELARQTEIDKQIIKEAEASGDSKTGVAGKLLGGFVGQWVGGHAGAIGGGLVGGPLGSAFGGGYGTVAGARKGWDKAKKMGMSEDDRAIHTMVKAVRLAHAAPMDQFKSVAQRLERNAKACLSLAERAMSAPKAAKEPAAAE